MGILDKIDSQLDELLSLVDETTYNNFILGNPIMKIYDEVAYLDNRNNILTNEILNKISKFIQTKIDMYK